MGIIVRVWRHVALSAWMSGGEAQCELSRSLETSDVSRRMFGGTCALLWAGDMFSNVVPVLVFAFVSILNSDRAERLQRFSSTCTRFAPRAEWFVSVMENPCVPASCGMHPTKDWQHTFHGRFHPRLETLYIFGVDVIELTSLSAASLVAGEAAGYHQKSSTWRIDGQYARWKQRAFFSQRNRLCFPQLPHL